MSRSAHPLPPRDVRLLAACSHLGLYFGVLLTKWVEIGSAIFHSPQPLDVFSWGTATAASASTVFLLAPPIAALWAARASPWRGFLRSHGSRALVFQSAALLGVLAVALVSGDIPHSEIVDVSFALIVCVFILVWGILPVGAAFRAKDGDLAWYPFVRRFFPDPPEPGWRTPLPAP